MQRTRRSLITVVWPVVAGAALSGCLSIALPKGGEVVAGVVTIRANESNKNERFRDDEVRFYVDGVLIGSDVGAPYTFLWDTKTVTDWANHALVAKAFSLTQQKDIASQPVTVYVRNIPDTAPPTINAISPQPSPALYAGDTLTFSASVTDNDPSPLEYQFSVDGTITQAWSAATTYQWVTTSAMTGSHTITVEARDAGGAASKTQTLYLYLKPPELP